MVRGFCECEPGGHAQAQRKAIEEKQKQLSRFALCRLGMWMLMKAMVTDPTLDMELRCQPSLFCAIIFASLCQRECGGKSQH